MYMPPLNHSEEHFLHTILLNFYTEKEVNYKLYNKFVKEIGAENFSFTKISGEYELLYINKTIEYLRAHKKICDKALEDIRAIMVK